jgi:DNA-binding NtrC family response regulator
VDDVSAAGSGLKSRLPPRALIVDDDPGFLLGLAELVRREGFAVASASSLKDAREQITLQAPDILLVDLRLPDGSGLDLLEAFEPHAAPEVLLITASASVETAVDALRRGVTDYLTKPVDFARVKMALGNVTRALDMKGEIGRLRAELRTLGRFGPLVGASSAMQKVYDLIGRVAPSDASMLITGETGTGKDVVAETVHALSRRSREAFVPVDCGSVSPSLIESELFGHERGSFTGAERLHRGYFERAHGGTLFLDEITEMPVELQVKLLRVLETSALTRVGGSQPLKVDVRILAATNRPLAQALADKKLREDLLYRLNVFTLPLPPLRERAGDVELLATHFLGELNVAESTLKQLDRGCFESLQAHSWPGNVRELRNVVQRAFVLAGDSPVIRSLPIDVAVERLDSQSTIRIGAPLAETERQTILATLGHFGGDKKKVAAALKISMRTLYARLREYKTR